MPRVVPSQVVDFIDLMAIGTTDSGQKVVTPEVILQLRGLIDLLDHVPDELIPLSGDDYNNWVLSVNAIRDFVLRYSAVGNLRGTVTLQYLDRSGRHDPVEVLRSLLVDCSDQVPSSDAQDLIFLKDHEFRDVLRADLYEVTHALAVGHWKSATVLAGSALEAMMLWRLDSASTLEDRRKAISSLGLSSNLDANDLTARSWGLHEYTEVAAKLGLISSRTATAVRQAKEFRNLIHPAAAIRKKQKSSRGTAFAAVAAVEFLIEDVSG